MPIYLPPLSPISRRRFLAGSLALGAAALLPRNLSAAEKTVDPDSFALLSDCHINADRSTVVNKANMADQLAQVSSEVLALEKRPAATVINGDLAHLKGEAKDYAALVDTCSIIGGIQIQSRDQSAKKTLSSNHAGNFVSLALPESKW